MTIYSRPDEKTRDKEIERAESFKRGFGNVGRTAIGLGTAAIGAGLSSKIAPFLNKYIPTNLALQGIKKLSPKLGNFLDEGMKMGLDPESGLDFIKSKLESKNEPAKENRNVIEQYSPELHQFIQGEIQQGRSPLEAGALAQANPKFKKVIQQISKDHKTDWSAILQTIFGGGQKAAQSKAALQEQPKAIQQQPQQQMQMQQPQQNQGNNDQALMAALDKILKM